MYWIFFWGGGLQMKGNRNKIITSNKYIYFDTKRNEREKIINRDMEPFYFSIKNCLVIYFSYFQFKEELLLDQLAKKACSKKLRWSNLGTHKPLNFD